VLLGASLGLCSSGLALAASTAQVVDWEAPESCPGALEVYDRLQHSVGDVRDRLGELGRVRGVVVPGERGYRLALEVLQRDLRSSRVLEAEDCNDLVDAAVLAITLALGEARGRDDAGLAIEPAPAQGEPARSTTDVPPPVGNAPDVRTDAEEAGSVLGGFLSVGALMEIGALPSATAGLGLGGGLRRGSLTLAAHGALLATQRSSVGPDESVELGLWFAGLRGCYAPLEGPFRIDACGGLQLGRYHASGIALRSARDVEDSWVAPEASLALAFPVSSSFSVTSGVALAVPLSRHRYTINVSESIHEPAWASLTFHLAVALNSGAERPAPR